MKEAAKTATTKTNPSNSIKVVYRKKHANKSAKVPLTTQFSGDIYDRLEKLTSDKGLGYIQDAVRLAVSSFLESAGY